MNKETCSRRGFIIKGIAPVLAAAGFFAVSCGEGRKEVKDKQEPETATKTDDCEDFSALTEKDLEARKKLGYVKESPIQDSKCGNCQLWLPPKEGKHCGNCQLFKGPVYTNAYCTYWAPQNDGNG